MQYLKLILLGLLLGWSIIEIFKSLERKDYSIAQQLKLNKKKRLQQEHQLITQLHEQLDVKLDSHKSKSFELIHNQCTATLYHTTNDIQEIITQIHHLYKTTLNSDAAFKLNFPEKSDLQFSPLNAYNILTILNEGLHNAARYSKATYITNILAIENNNLQLVTHDTGKGFDKTTTKQADGLKRIQQMVQEHNGEVNITSTENGTIVNSYLPLTSISLS